jgi:predicted lipoprotein with Yx(FWY)xxD motif
VTDGLAAAVVLTGVTVGMANISGAMTAGNHSTARTLKVSTTTIPHVGTVLTSASGLTLYRFTQDPVGMSVCTGACAKIWPPLTASKGEHVAGPKGVKGLSVINVGHGRWQLAFHNVALYRYAGDTKKGQAHGQGVAHTWFAALKSGIPAAAAATPSTSTSTSPSPAPSGGSTATTPTPAPTPAPTPVTTPVTAPPVTAPPTTTPTTQPPTTTTTMGSGGYGY